MMDGSAPRFTVRFDSRLLGHVNAQPEALRRYLERLVHQDLARVHGEAELPGADLVAALLGLKRP